MIAENKNLSLEETLAKASPSLQNKIKDSVAFLKKALPLALKYDPDNGFHLGFSGGKDSQVIFHLAKLAEVPFIATFSPTTVDPPQVIRFIRSQYPSVRFRRVSKSIYTIAKERRLLPTMTLRWCCNDFKENNDPGTVTIVGVRHQESTKRAKRKEVEIAGHKFSGTLQEFQDQFSPVTKPTTIRCVGGRDKIVVMPILSWSEDDVWQFLNKVVEAPHCSLYDEGYKRIGCILCPMQSHRNALRDIKRFPNVYRRWLDVCKYLLSNVDLSSPPPQYVTKAKHQSSTRL